jgi:hypothetical protein
MPKKVVFSRKFEDLFCFFQNRENLKKKDMFENLKKFKKDLKIWPHLAFW